MSKNPPTGKLDGTRTIADLAQITPTNFLAYGKQSIADLGARSRQIAGLKPGSTSIRTIEMEDEIILRLRSGEALSSINNDPNMPSEGALWNWRHADPDLDERIRDAQAKGAHFLRDATLDIALGGAFSTGDIRRDELVIKTIERNIAQRNRRDFGDKVQVDHKSVIVNLDPLAVALASGRSIDLPPESIRVEDLREDGAGDLAE